MFRKLLNSNVRWRKSLALGAILLGVALWSAALPAWAQMPLSTSPLSTSTLIDPAKKSSKHQERQNEQPSQPPGFSLAVEALGFAAPGPSYLGQRNSIASLDFLDEDHLLFTFRVPGLVHRNPTFDNGQESDERHIKAVVLELPSGTVEAEALWTLEGHARYLWALKDGHFLLRDGNDLKQGDATLALKPLLHFPAPLDSIDLDPLEKFLVTESHEPVVVNSADSEKMPDTGLRAVENSEPRLRPQIGPQAEVRTRMDINRVVSAASYTATETATPNPTAASAPASTTAAAASTSPEIVIRILERSSGQVVRVSRVPAAVHVQINSNGYLEALQGQGTDWAINYYAFDGAVLPLGHVVSNCIPAYEFANDLQVLVTTCSLEGGSKQIVLGLDGRRLWETSAANIPVWPRTIRATNGLRLVREVLALDRTVSASAPLQIEDVKTQKVNVYDAANGNLALTATASPVLDGGGNVGLSPSGKRVAVLYNGAIEIWNLDAPPALPTPVPVSSSHP